MFKKCLCPLTALLALAAVFCLSCSDDGPSMPREEGSSSSDGGNGSLSSLVEISADDDGTLEDLVACTMDNAGNYATIGKTSYICYGYQWRELVGIFETMGDLTACTENRQSKLALIKKDRKILECSNMQWGAYHVPARSYVSAEDLPSCTPSRQWEYNYIESTGDFALCNKEMWQPLVDVQESAEDLLACTSSRDNGMALIMRATDSAQTEADTSKYDVTKGDTTVMICSSQRWIVYREAAPDTAADSTSTSDDAKVDALLPNVTGLQVSRWVGDGVLLLSWDVPDWNPALVGGLVIERDKNYTGWRAVDTLVGNEIRGALWADSALDVTNQMKYRYRLYTIPIDTALQNRSNYTEIVGTMAVDAWGFVDGGFDVPTGFTGCWMYGNEQHIAWDVSRMANAGGWVLQALGHQDTSIDVPSYADGFYATGPQGLTRGHWFDLDTLSEDNNKYWISWPAYVGYRIYAYYVDEYSGLTSEYSPEVSFSSIVSCDASMRPVYGTASAKIAVDTSKTMSVSWEAPSAFYDCQQVTMNGAPYPTTCADGPAAGVYNGCVTLTDENGDSVPCWDLGFTSFSWDVSMPVNPKAYAVRGTVIDKAGTGIYEFTTSAWAK